MKEKRERKGRIEDDPNYVAYKAQEEELKTKHMGEWVAFSDGQLVAIAKDIDSLLKETHERGIRGVFFTEIVAKERVFHLRSPRIVRD